MRHSLALLLLLFAPLAQAHDARPNYVQITETEYSRFSDKDIIILEATYDPTNGTITKGDLWLTIAP